MGHGGDRLVAQITGLDEKTIRHGRVELDASLADCRRAGAAPWGLGVLPPKKDPAIVPALQELVAPETAGDPMSEQKCGRSSLGSSRNKGAFQAVCGRMV